MMKLIKKKFKIEIEREIINDKDKMDLINELKKIKVNEVTYYGEVYNY